MAHRGDITEDRDIRAMIDVAVSTWGRIDVLVNNAGGTDLAAGGDSDVESMDLGLWDRMMAVNLRGPMLACKYALPTMTSGGGGSIVNVASTAAFAGDVGLAAYSASKAGVLGLTRAVATSHGKRGIRCNAVAPGSVVTPAAAAMMGEEFMRSREATRLTPRLGRAEDVAHMVAYLASDRSSYVTGQTFLVDGGGFAHQPWVVG